MYLRVFDIIYSCSAMLRVSRVVVKWQRKRDYRIRFGGAGRFESAVFYLMKHFRKKKKKK